MGSKFYQFEKMRQDQKHMIYKFENFNSNLHLENLPNICSCWNIDQRFLKKKN
jgi:uncharacterized Fe-S cluster-containing protein